MLNFPQTLSDESKRMLEMCFDWCVSVLQGKRRQCFSGPVHEDTVMMSDSQGLGTEHFTLVTVLSLKARWWSIIGLVLLAVLPPVLCSFCDLKQILQNSICWVV